MTAAVGSIAAIGLQADSVQQSDDRQADDGGSRKYSGDRITGRFGTAKRSGRQAGYATVTVKELTAAVVGGAAASVSQTTGKQGTVGGSREGSVRRRASHVQGGYSHTGGQLTRVSQTTGNQAHSGWLGYQGVGVVVEAVIGLQTDSVQQSSGKQAGE
jgi:hypothetical protein